jgi:adenylate kinase
VSRRFGDFKIGDRCDKCDGALVKRNLDDVLDERLKEYRTRTVPGIEYLKKHYNVITINGEQSIEDVHKDIMKSLSAMLTK